MKIQAWPGKAVTHQFIINSCQILGNWPEDSFSIIPSYLLQLNFLLFKNKECFFSLYLILISVECKSLLKWLAVYKALVHAIFWDRAQNILNEGKEGDMPGISCQKSRTVIQGPCAVVSQGQGMRKRKWNGSRASHLPCKMPCGSERWDACPAQTLPRGSSPAHSASSLSCPNTWVPWSF